MQFGRQLVHVSHKSQCLFVRILRDPEAPILHNVITFTILKTRPVSTQTALFIAQNSTLQYRNFPNFNRQDFTNIFLARLQHNVTNINILGQIIHKFRSTTFIYQENKHLTSQSIIQSPLHAMTCCRSSSRFNVVRHQNDKWQRKLFMARPNILLIIKLVRALLATYIAPMHPLLFSHSLYLL